MERCNLLEEERGRVGKEERCTWKTRPVQKIEKKKKKGPVGPKKEAEKDDLELFFSSIYEFHNPVQHAPAFVPAALPPRYAISFVPTANAPVSSGSVSTPSVSVSVPACTPVPVSPSTDYSVISFVNFVLPTSSHCIGQTQ